MEENNITCEQFKFGTKDEKPKNKYPKERELKEEIDKRYFDMGDEEKDILKKHNLFYHKSIPKYKIARALLIMKDEIERLEKIIIKIKKS